VDPDHREARYPFEIAGVGGSQIHAVSDGCGCDPEIMRADGRAATLEFGPDSSVCAGDREGDRRRLDQGENVLHKGLATAADALAAGAMNSMQELACGDCADRPILLADRVVKRQRAPLGSNHHTCVDQDGQAPRGEPTLSRTASRSDSNSSST